MVPRTATTVSEALQQLNATEDELVACQLLICDCLLKDAEDVTLLERIRSDQRFDGASIIALTSSFCPAELKHCPESAVVARLTKPVKHSELLSAVVLALDLSRSGPRRPVAEQTGSRETLAPLRVLVAEDSFVGQRLITLLLEQQGHQVTAVNNGKQVIAQWESGEYDVVLMDLEMPDMDGFEATAAIRMREHACPQRTPIIALTAHVMHEDRQRCLKAGMDGYVPKPIHAEQLFEALESVLPVPHEARGSRLEA
jgi:CheY-like chemotaxis protein